MSVQTRDFLKRRRDRALGTIMGHLERSTAWDHLDPDARRDVRDRVVEALNSFYDCVLDLVKAEDDVVRNDYMVEMLERIDAGVRRARPTPHDLPRDLPRDIPRDAEVWTPVSFLPVSAGDDDVQAHEAQAHDVQAHEAQAHDVQAHDVQARAVVGVGGVE